MGSACCVAAKVETLPNRNENLNRNVVRCPSFDFQCDSQGSVAGEIENPSYHMSPEVTRNIGLGSERSILSERANLSNGGRALENVITSIPKSPDLEALKTPFPPVLANAIYCSTVVKNPSESSEIGESKYGHLPNSVPSRWAHHSPGSPFLSQISDSRILGLKSPDNSISEGRPSSFFLSNCSNDLSTWSQGGSSQREGWSFNSEYLGSGHSKTSGSSGRFSCSSPSIDIQSCGACSKHLSERCGRSNRKFIESNDLSVVAVLVCGHVYHAECLETMTAEADKYDPVCPICIINGEKQGFRLSRKGSVSGEAEIKARTHKVSKNRVVDSYVEGGFDVFDEDDKQKEKEYGNEGIEKFEKMEASCSSRSRGTHLSLGSNSMSKWSRSLLDNDSARKKSFWSRNHRDNLPN